MLNTAKLLCSLVLATLLITNIWAQGMFATLTGVVSDPSGATVANAKVTLRDAQSGSARGTVTDNDGYYTFASVPVGTYVLTVEAPGFQGYKVEGVALGGDEKRNVNASLQVGNTNQTVEVVGAADIIAPVDSGVKADILTTKELQNYVQVGSNAAEYIKILPGFGNQNGTSNKANYSGQVIGINANGDAGSQSPLNNAFSYNGLPGNSLDIVADGAHVSDRGCNCDTPVNPNSDFIQEFRVLASNFSAEEQKGPMVITTVTKSGGAQFHGNAFFSAKNYVLNSNGCHSIYGEVRLNKDELIKDYREKLGIDAPAKSPYSSMGNRQLSEVASALAVKIRELSIEYITRTTPGSVAEQNSEAQNILDRYNSRYKIEALLLHDEMYLRIGKQALLLVKPEARFLIAFPTNGIGLGMVADNLQLLAKNLPA